MLSFLAALCSFSLVVYFVGCFLFKLATLSEQPDVLAVLTPEQTIHFDVPSTELTFLLMSAVCGMLVASGVVLGVRIGQEKVRQKRELRAARARRLIYLTDDSEVLLPKLPPLEKLLPDVYPYLEDDGYPMSVPQAGPFHVFLSHNWEQCVTKHAHAPPLCATRDAQLPRTSC
jgi:hypothetical protein